MSKDSESHQRRRLPRPLSQPDIVPAAMLQSAVTVGKTLSSGETMSLKLRFILAYVHANIAHLLLIHPEVKQKIDDEFNQPLLHNCRSETGSEAKLSLCRHYSD